MGIMGALPSAIRVIRNRIAHRAVVAKQMIGAKMVNFGLRRLIGNLLCGKIIFLYYNPIFFAIQ